MQNLALENLENCIVSPLNEMVSGISISKNDIEEIIEEVKKGITAPAPMALPDPLNFN